MGSPIGLSPPWACFYREIEALFKDDPEIHIVYDEQNYEIKLYVDNPSKADALEKLLPSVKNFGNVNLYIEVIPADTETNDGLSLFEAAFAGNPAFKYVAQSPKIAAKYVIFANKVVQYFNDSLSDAHGVRSTLYQDIARDVFGDDCGVYFCTDLEEKSAGAPLGEWP